MNFSDETNHSGENRDGFSLFTSSEAVATRKNYIGLRSLAFLIDLAVLSGFGVFVFLLNVMSLFVFSALMAVVLAFTPLAYATFMIGRFGGATIGMRLMGIRTVDAKTKTSPSLIQAFLMSLLFYASFNLAGIPLLWAFFDREGRCLHDIFTRVEIRDA